MFLIDGVGALVSAFMLGVVLTQFDSLFGMPISTLNILRLILNVQLKSLLNQNVFTIYLGEKKTQNVIELVDFEHQLEILRWINKIQLRNFR